LCPLPLVLSLGTTEKSLAKPDADITRRAIAATGRAGIRPDQSSWETASVFIILHV